MTATRHPHDSDTSDTLCALAQRLRTQAAVIDDDVDLLVATAARQRQRGVLLRREADRLDELCQKTSWEST